LEPFDVHILGCGSALPTLRHNASSQIVDVRGKLFMIDCAEGTQIQLRKYHINFNRISVVLISHLHGDHCFGLIGMISSFGMKGRTAPLHIYASIDLQKILEPQLDYFCQGLGFDVIFHSIDTTTSYVIYEDNSLTIKTLPLNHRVPCCGFLFMEKQTLPHILRDLIDFYGIPLSQVNNIKNGASWITADGDVIESSRLTVPADNPRSYAYCSDTKYMPDLFKSIVGVDLLYHESTYASESVERARTYYHSTAAQAASVALAAHVGKLVLGHYSARYDDENIILNEAKAIFPNSVLSNEGDVFKVGKNVFHVK
jgi:ribonuclease Z